MQLEAEKLVPSAVRTDRPELAEFIEYQRTGDRRVRDRLVGAYVGLAYKCARRFSGRGEDSEDLRQVALIALVQAVDRFDPGRGLAFATFATPTIIGSLKRHFRDRAWAVRPPRSVQERFLDASAAVERLTAHLHRPPTIAEISDDGAWSEDEVREALAAQQCRNLLHWGLPGEDGVFEPSMTDRGASTVEDRLVIDDLLELLGERERAVVKMRYLEDLDQAAIGRRIGVSQMHVSRLLSRSIDRIRAARSAS